MIRKLVNIFAPLLEARGSLSGVTEPSAAHVAARICGELGWELRDTSTTFCRARTTGRVLGDRRHLAAAFSSSADVELYKEFRAHVDFEPDAQLGQLTIRAWERPLIPSPSERIAFQAALEAHVQLALDTGAA